MNRGGDDQYTQKKKQGEAEGKISHFLSFNSHSLSLAVGGNKAQTLWLSCLSPGLLLQDAGITWLNLIMVTFNIREAYNQKTMWKQWMKELLKTIIDGILQRKGSALCSSGFFPHCCNSSLLKLFLNFLLLFSLKSRLSAFSFPVAYSILTYVTPHLHNIDSSLPAEQLHSWLLFHNSFCARYCYFFLPSFCHTYQFFRTWNICNSVYVRQNCSGFYPLYNCSLINMINIKCLLLA